MTIYVKLSVATIIPVIAFIFVVALPSHAQDVYVRGKSAPGIRIVQTALNATSCRVSLVGRGSPGNETEYFGTKTRNAVACFQEREGLPVTGALDTATYTALYRVYLRNQILVLLRSYSVTDPVAFFDERGLEPEDFGLAREDLRVSRVASATETVPSWLSPTPGPGGGSLIGHAVAIDGDIAVVGAPGVKGGGAAYVFTRSKSAWQQEGKLVPPSDQATGSEFGDSVAVSESTNTVVVGSPEKDLVYVFTRSGNTWSREDTLMAGEGAVDSKFGTSIAINGDVVVVGAPEYNGSDKTKSGAVYVYTRTGTTWSDGEKIGEGEAAGDFLGRAVAIDGNTIIAGAPSHSQRGGAFVYTESGETWSQQETVLVPGGSDGVINTHFGFGYAVDLNGDIAVVGVPGAGGANFYGAAYIFTRAGSSWDSGQKIQRVEGKREINDYFGYSVSVGGSGDEARVVVGARGADDVTSSDPVPNPNSEGTTANPWSGIGFIYARGSGGSWEPAGRVPVPNQRLSGEFGTSIAISGTTIVAGSPKEYSNRGSVWVFELGSVTSGGGDTSSPDPVSPPSPKPIAPVAEDPAVIDDSDDPTVREMHFYSDRGLSDEIAHESYKRSGDTIYTKVVFSEDMKHVAGSGSSARPELFIHNGNSLEQYGIVNHGAAYSSGDCWPYHETDQNVYVCQYDVPSSINDTFRVSVGAASADKNGNLIAGPYTHEDFVYLDTTGPDNLVVNSAAGGNKQATITVTVDRGNPNIPDEIHLVFGGDCASFGENGVSPSVSVPVGTQIGQSHTFTVSAPSGLYDNCVVKVVDRAGNETSDVTIPSFRVRGSSGGGGGGGGGGGTSVRGSSRGGGGGGGGGGSYFFGGGAPSSPTETPTVTYDPVSDQEETRVSDPYTQGQTAEGVRTVQRALNATPCKVAAVGPGSPGNESAYFGAKTRNALICYQSIKGFPVTGRLDALTHLTLRLDYVKGRLRTYFLQNGIDAEQFFESRGLSLSTFGWTMADFE